MSIKAHIKIILPVLLVTALYFAACGKKDSIAQEENDRRTTEIFNRGAGSLVYGGYSPLSDRRITLFYYVPTQGDIRHMKVVFSMHGDERSGQTQRNTWQNLAEEYGFVVFAPQFSRANGYSNNDYQFGGVSDNGTRFSLNSSELWTFNLIENLFDFFKRNTGNTSDRYHLFGHSGGGQFVHRLLLTMPNARVGVAVVANPGNYTFLNDNGFFAASGLPADPRGWPYSIHGTPFVTDEYLVPFLKRDMIVMAGTNDTDLVPANLPADHPINLQGLHRYARAQNFFNTSRSLAEANRFDFHWQYKEVPHVGHSTSGMLYGKPGVASTLIEGDQRVYNNEELTDKGAFSLMKAALLPGSG